MIQRASRSARPDFVNEDGTVNYEMVHLMINELQTHIGRLKKSNEEIAEYLNRSRDEEQAGEEEDDGAEEPTMSALVQAGPEKEAKEGGAVLNDDDDDVFREALVENEHVIHRKEKELAALLLLVKDQRCGCHFHRAVGEPHVAPPTDVAPDVPSDRITL